MVRDKDKFYAEPNDLETVTAGQNLIDGKLIAGLDERAVKNALSVPNSIYTTEGYLSLSSNKILGTNTDGNLAWFSRKQYGLKSFGQQWISTELPTTPYQRIEVDMIITKNSVIDSPVFGARLNYENGMILWYNYNPGLGLSWRYGATYDTQKFEIPFGRIICTTDDKKYYINGSYIGTSTSAGNTTCVYPSALFGYSDSNTTTDARRFEGTIYDFKLWSANVLARHFIPVPKFDMTYGPTPAPSNCMWCFVTKKYYENKGSGNFEIVEVN